MFNRLTFAHRNVPTHFYRIIIYVLNEANDMAVVFLDDIVLLGDYPEKLWEAAVTVIGKLTTIGFMLNTKKPEFLVT